MKLHKHISNNITGIFTIFKIFLKKLIKEIAKVIWEFLTRKRFIKSYKKKKAILFIFLIIVDMHIWNGVIDVINQPTEKIIIERIGVLVTSQEVSEAYDSLGGAEGDTLPSSTKE